LKLKIKGFTLLESLVALLAISGSVLVISSLAQLMQNQMQIAQNDSEKDWQIFCEQMRTELAGENLDKIKENQLFVTGAKSLRFSQSGEEFRKTDIKGRGYQPMLYGVKNVKIQEMQELITIQIEFKKGGEHTFVYKFSGEK
jgi:competence protein ComGF